MDRGEDPRAWVAGPKRRDGYDVGHLSGEPGLPVVLNVTAQTRPRYYKPYPCLSRRFRLAGKAFCPAKSAMIDTAEMNAP